MVYFRTSLNHGRRAPMVEHLMLLARAAGDPPVDCERLAPVRSLDRSVAAALERVPCDAAHSVLIIHDQHRFRETLGEVKRGLKRLTSAEYFGVCSPTGICWPESRRAAGNRDRPQSRLLLVGLLSIDTSVGR